MPATTEAFVSVHPVGSLLPMDMLRRIADGRDVSAAKPADYHIVGARTSVKEAAERRWDYLKGAWRALRDSVGDGGDPAGLAIENWLLPLFDELGFGRLPALHDGIRSDDERTVFPVSHTWQHLPIYLVGWGQRLDERPPTGGLPPQSMLQECLNRTQAYLWGIVSNGRVLRILRDSTSLTGASYLEIDLEAMFDGELFDEFVLLYRLLHVSRYEVEDGAAPSTCRMEKWRTEAIEAGARALDLIRDGVEAALVALGTGFRRHPANVGFRDDIDPDLVKRALLRLVYRLLFWFVAEERDALHAEDTDEKVRDRYRKYFSARRLREASLRGSGTAHGDLWQAVQLVLGGLGDENGRPQLGLPGLGGIYDDTGTDQVLHGLQLSNEYLLAAVRFLSRFYDTAAKRYRLVDYLHLGSEELGSIYESLLELVPKWGGDRQFLFRETDEEEQKKAGGNERKKTGSYYTPTSLIDCLLDSVLDPVLDDAIKRAEIAATAARTDASEAIAEALLSVTVCDPACGSGHFLVAAARQIAKRVACVREHNPEPSLDALRHAMRDVVANCVYGVDLNPMAVELAKVSLWMEGVEAGKPLSFLDAHIKQGNALIGATPKLIDGGIPAGAFKPIEGDDPKFARSLERANSGEQSLTSGQRRVARFSNSTPTLPGTGPEQFELFSDEIIFSQSNALLAAALEEITHLPDGTLREVHEQAAEYERWQDSPAYLRARQVADAWCAAFMWLKRARTEDGHDVPPAIVNRVFQALRERGSTAIPPATVTEIERLREEYGFFHWHLEFPGIFQVRDDDQHADPGTSWSGGFSCVLANPPWDKVDFEDKKYFSVVEPSIALMTGQNRRDRIVKWEMEHEDEGNRYRAARRKVKGTFGFASSSDAYPWCAKGLTAPGVNSLQTDQLFAERFAAVTAPTGRIGCIIPTAIATGAGGQFLFGDFTRRGAVASLYDFENRRQLFPAVDSRQKFCLLSLAGRALSEPSARYAFFLLDTAELDDAGRIFALSPEELALVNPNTGTLPIFRNGRDASLTTEIYQRVPVLWDEKKQNGNPWGITFKNLFNMTDDSDLFRTREQLESRGWRLDGNVFTRDGERMLPLYEAKMIDFFNHRAADVVKSATAVNRQNQPSYLTQSELHNPTRYVQPLHWIAEEGGIPTRRNGRDVKVPGVAARLSGLDWDHGWLCGWCDVTSATNERTAIPAFLPRVAVGHKFPLMFPGVSSSFAAALIATQSSLIFDFFSRQKIGGVTMGLFIWKQLPVPTPAMIEPHLPFLVPRVLELVYTAYDMTPLARDLGDEGAPFRWGEDRRALLRAELDAFFFRMYGIDDRDDVDYILETFQTETGGLKHNDIAKYGTYRTKDLVLATYDRMAAADATGVPYTTAITPPPGEGPRHPAR
jgi:hypothetical protein